MAALRFSRERILRRPVGASPSSQTLAGLMVVCDDVSVAAAYSLH
jgi:hypothetical protein